MPITINIPTLVSQTITNGVTAYAPSEDAVFDALAGKISTLKNTTPFTITSTGSDQVAHSYNLTGYLSVGDLFSVGILNSYSFAATTKMTRIYLNSTNDLSGSPVLIAEFSHTASSYSRGIRRDFRVDGNTTLNVNSIQGSSSFFDITPAVDVPPAGVTIPNITGNIFLIITGQRSTSGTVMIFEYSSIMKF